MGAQMSNMNIGAIESSKVEFKVSLEKTKPKSWLKSVSAFANTNGGHIFFGVSDKEHEKVGLDDPQETASKISELISARITPTPRFQLTEFESDLHGRICLDLLVENGPNYPYYYAHQGVKEVYVRHGDRSELATDYELNGLILKGRHLTYDALPSQVLLEDVSFTLLAATYKQRTGSSLDFPKDLYSMCLVTDDNHVTNAGLLLCDQGLIRQSRIFCTRWKGNHKGSVEGDALDDKEFQNESLISLLSDAESFVRNNSYNPWTVRGMRRDENSDYPIRAIREVVVNAMMHRDYQIIGAEIHIDMFDDRIEIVSPGGMMNGAKIQDLDLRKVPSMRRNEIIADFFGRLDFMDRRGSGIGRILDSYDGFLRQPEFESDENYFYVMLPNRSVAEKAQVSIDEYPYSEKSQSAGEKSQSAGEKSQSGQSGKQGLYPEVDWEMAYFQENILKQYENNFRTKTMEQLTVLFNKYRHQYPFNRRNIAELFGITENGASRFITKCMERGIIERVKVDTYRFSGGGKTVTTNQLTDRGNNENE